jgi:hypothetical protein
MDELRERVSEDRWYLPCMTMYMVVTRSYVVQHMVGSAELTPTSSCAVVPVKPENLKITSMCMDFELTAHATCWKLAACSEFDTSY